MIGIISSIIGTYGVLYANMKTRKKRSEDNDLSKLNLSPSFSKLKSQLSSSLKDVFNKEGLKQKSGQLMEHASKDISKVLSLLPIQRAKFRKVSLQTQENVMSLETHIKDSLDDSASITEFPAVANEGKETIARPSI